VKQRIVELLRSRNRFAIFSHVDPDGDALGSALGLSALLEAMGKRTEVFVPGPIPRIYRFLPGAPDIHTQAQARSIEGDAMIVLDATSLSRIGPFEELISREACLVNIDHHSDNTRFGDMHWVEPEACATALLIVELAREGGFEIPRSAAACLYVGILTDTGRFTFSNTGARALETAAKLVDLGADPHELATKVYARASAASTLLLGRVLATLELHEEGRIACLHATNGMMLETGTLPEDADGFSTFARSIEGVKVGIFFREAPDGAIKVSFRSNEGVEIDGVAGQFGGGGHPRASGARVSGPIEEAKENVLRAVAEHLRSTAL
jgi:phosphoesterase RecJ-like protein